MGSVRSADGAEQGKEQLDENQPNDPDGGEASDQDEGDEIVAGVGVARRHISLRSRERGGARKGVPGSSLVRI
jgi:hypothetical protein